jgi:hypothetical protein
MAVARIVIGSVAGLEILGALFFAGCNHRISQPAISGLGGAGSSPVRIVGGSMTFRAYLVGWKPLNSGFQTQTAVNATVVSLIHVVRQGSSASEPTDYLNLPLQDKWSIEVDGTKYDNKAASENGVIVSPYPGGYIKILPLKSGSFYGNGTPEARTWDPAKYPGVRYKDQTSSCDTNRYCESIYQFQVTPGNGSSTTTYYCPDGECRAKIGTP